MRSPQASLRSNKSLYVVPVESSTTPLHIPVRSHYKLTCSHRIDHLQLSKGGEAFWLDSRVICHAVETDDGTELYAIDLKHESQSGSELSTSGASTLLGKIPTKTAANFRYSTNTGYLIFSDYAWPDGNLSTVKAQDDEWDNRGNSAYVYDATYVRHWDTWVGDKKPALFSVRLARDPDTRKWIYGDEYYSPLKGTGHVSI